MGSKETVDSSALIKLTSPPNVTPQRIGTSHYARIGTHKQSNVFTISKVTSNQLHDQLQDLQSALQDQPIERALIVRDDSYERRLKFGDQDQITILN